MQPIRILIAKPGLDGHDRGAKVVVRALRDAGFEVIYTGLKQTVEQIVRAVVQEDPDIVGLSVLSGAHQPICDRLLPALAAASAGDVPVVVGGNIPRADVPALLGAGVKAVFPFGSSLDEMPDRLRELVR
ncbi:MAG: cobalamin-dependent protein [Myxococcota bacterium]|jgi:methylmalonyl-CoA mutase C-terminal domain/subunit|nr:cobalamin-dependent protein [Myxococcota bacterium]